MSYKDLLRKGMGITSTPVQPKAKATPTSAAKALLGIKEEPVVAVKVKETHWCDECEIFSDKPHIHADEDY
jgi:hypothetical protein